MGSFLGSLLGGIGSLFGPVGSLVGGGLGSLIGGAQQAVAPSGSGFNATENANQGQLSNDALQLLNQIMPGLTQDNQYAMGYEPQRQNDIQTQLMNLSAGNTKALGDAYTNQAFANSARAAKQSSAQNQAEGYSPALAAGDTTAINNQAANQSNQYQAYLQSPEFQLQQGLSRLQLYNQGQTSPFSSNLSQYGGLLYGQPRAPVGPSYLGNVAPILGNAASGIFGSSGGSQQGSNNYGLGSMVNNDGTWNTNDSGYQNMMNNQNTGESLSQIAGL